MRITTRLYRAINRLLEKADLQLTPIARDFDARLADDALVDRLVGAVGGEIEDWLARQTLFEVKGSFGAADARGFYEEFLRSPFRRRGGGSRFNNLLSLYAVTKCFAPTLVVDSGTFTGASAWAMGLAAPEAQILSFDIDLGRLLRRAPNARYIERDWMKEPIEIGPGERSMAYFDDHVDQAQRLLEAHQVGIDLSIFDDDFSVNNFASFAHSGFALPKVEFVLDDHLRSLDALRWSEKGRSFAWPVDVDYLDRARATIAATDRLPDTSRISGIEQLPYRLVKMAD